MDQIARHRADDMRPKNAVRRFVGKDFDKSVAREIRLGAAIAHKAELTDLIIDSVFFKLLFGFADIRDLGVGVDDTGYHTIVNMRFLTRQTFGAGHAFVFGLMRQHRPVDTITKRVNARYIGLVMGVSLDLSTLGDFDTQLCQTQAVGERAAARGDQNSVGVHRAFAVVAAQFVRDGCLVIFGINGLHRRAHYKLKPLFFQQTLECFLHFAVHAGCDFVQVFDHRDLGPKAAVHGPEFKADHTGTNDDHVFGDLAQFQRAGG